MRRLLVTGLAMLVACSVPAAGAAPKRHECIKRGAVTLRQDERARVFYVDRDGEYIYYGCLFRTGRSRVIGTGPYDGGLDDLGRFQLRSPWVAYVEFGGGSGFTSQELQIFDIQTGRTRARLDTGSSDGSTLTQFALTSFGAIAWIKEDRFVNGTGDVRVITKVHKLDASGRGVLDPGPSVAPRSLALTPSGRRVYWTNAGEPRSAKLVR